MNAVLLPASAARRLIVNADDFGYFDGVSRGIIDCAERGVVTATGVMANGPALGRWTGRLRSLPELSVGVHLNATLGQPLTSEMRAALSRTGGAFPSKERLVTGLLSGRLSASLIHAEWRAQVERCREAGLNVVFLNSHEHVHALPVLGRIALGLADEFGIAHVRAPKPDWDATRGSAAVMRNGVLAALSPFQPDSLRPTPRLIGLSVSGRLDLEYCRRRLASLESGTYELMCHPGWRDEAALRDERLARYHDWELELETLTGRAFGELLVEYGISLVSFDNRGAAELAR